MMPFKNKVADKTILSSYESNNIVKGSAHAINSINSLSNNLKAKAPKFLFALVIISLVLVQVACTRGSAITDQDLAKWNERHLDEVFQDQDAILAPLTVSQAIARSLKYNLQRKVALLEEELAISEIEIALYDMLPTIVIGARVNGRTRPDIRGTKFEDTGLVLPPAGTYSSDYVWKVDADGQFAWNVIDFGINFVRSKQAKDRAYIAAERRRKAVQEIINEVQVSFWQAAAAQRLAGDVSRLIPRVDEAVALRRREETSGARPPLESLAEQRTLLELKRQLLAINNTLVNSKATLANLIGLRPGATFAINVRESAGLPNLNISIEALENFGLNNRPELVEEAYSDRIARNDVLAASLAMIPGLSLAAGYNYTTDSLVKYNNWANYGAQATWNLLNIGRSISAIKVSQNRVKLIQQRRLAVAISVLTQIRLSWLNYWQTREQYQAAVDFSNVENRILQRVQAMASSGNVGELELIRAFMNALIGELNKDLAYADLRASLNRVLISIGADPTPDALSGIALKDVELDIKRSLAFWQEDLLAKIRYSSYQSLDKYSPQPASYQNKSSAINEIASANLAANSWVKPTLSKEMKELIDPSNGYKWVFHQPPSVSDELLLPKAPVSYVIGKDIQLLDSN